MNPVISVTGLTKEFPIGRPKPEAWRLRDLFRRHRTGGNVFRALDNLNLEVNAGEVVGVLGRNGAGKSTLLKILARIIPPTAGRAVLHGRVGSLLEVGTGFHPDLTGRENVYLGAALLGMKAAEIRSRFDEIVAFSGIEAFLDTPVRHYSTGMYMRLAFSVAAHLQPEILLVDEVLAVGDAEFQRKCLQRLEQLGSTGQAVIFVSHNMQAVTRLCNRAILIDRGKLVEQGPVSNVVAAYLNQGLTHPGERFWEPGPYAPGDSVARLSWLRIRNEAGETVSDVNIGEPFVIDIRYEVLTPGFVLFPSVAINNEWGTQVIWSTDAGTPEHGKPRPAGMYQASVRIPGNLLSEGMMTLTVAVTSLQPKKVHFSEPDAVHFHAREVLDGSTARGAYTDYVGSVVRPRLEWTVEYEPAG